MPLPSVITDIYQTGSVVGPTGVGQAPTSHVALDFAEALYRIVLEHRPLTVLEVGMAYGTTTCAAAQALEELGGEGRVISIDPFQSTDWENIGVLNVQRCGLAPRHRLIEAPDFVALPALLAEGVTVDLAYIDGLHSFEYALLDFFYVDKMLRIGGVVGFNDTDWPAVIPTLRFLKHHRAYESVDAGLPAMRRGNRNEFARQVRRVARKLGVERWVEPVVSRRNEDRYYRKVRDWEPEVGWMP